MIDKFKNSSIGQMLIAAFFGASVVAGIVIWFYESIRIPTLTGQLAFQENRVNSLEDSVVKEKEKTKILETAIENEKIESAKYRAIAKQTADELGQVGDKLRRTKEEQVKISKELSAAKMDRLKSEPSKAGVTNHPKGVAISFENAVLSAADKEDVAFLVIDNYVSELRLVSYSMFIQEWESNYSKILTSKNFDSSAKYLSSIIEKSNSYRDFVLNLEKLRVHVTKIILEHYRQKLKKFEHHASVAFFSEIRQQIQILTELGELVKKLKSIENSENWNTNATKTIDEFINSNSGLADQSLKIEGSMQVK